MGANFPPPLSKQIVGYRAQKQSAYIKNKIKKAIILHHNLLYTKIYYKFLML